MENRLLNEDLGTCIEEVFRMYEADTIILLDRVLTDDETEPELSANTVYRRLEQIVRFRSLYYGEKTESVDAFLSVCSYSRTDIDDLHRRMASEDRRYGHMRQLQKNGTAAQ